MKLNLYYVANARIPTDRAHGIQIMKMCAAFAQEGFAVTLVVPQRRNPIPDDPFEFHEVPRSFRITRLFAGDLIGNGALWFFVETLMFSISSFFFLISHPRGIVYSRDELPALIATFTGHDVFWESHIGKYNHIVKMLLSRIQGLVTISEGLKDTYLSLGVSEEKMIVAHDGAELPSEGLFDKRIVRMKYDIPENSFLVSYTGRLVPEKGIYTLLEASKQFSQNCVLAVAGEGDDILQLRAKYPHVRFLGHLPPKESILLQRSSDLLVIPNSSRNNISRSLTSPMKLFEYFASGVPVLASDVPSIRAIAQNGEVLWFKSDDPNDLASKILEHVQTPLLGESAARAALNSLTKFTWTMRAKTILEFIKQHGTMGELKDL